MSTYNGIPIVFDNESDNGLLGSLFPSNNNPFSPFNGSFNNYKSPLSEPERPINGSSLLTNKASSVFEDDFRYLVDLKLFDSGLKAFEIYGNAKLNEREIFFYCEKTTGAQSNLFGTFILVKFGAKARELLYKLSNNVEINISSSLNTNGLNTSRRITTFQSLAEEISEMFIKKYGQETDKGILSPDNIKKLIRQELHATSTTSITVKEIYSWYNNGVSTVINGINKWLEEIKFSKTDYTPNKKHQDSKKMEEFIGVTERALGAMLPNALKEFLEKGVDNA